ncbi:hypothetical protein KKD62_03320 [Patescibacteria group bacterium]|nr:hypothetical protein [Patescibacteria group bacterium]MBU1931317.1 hypothetical protein [Patescibacteria group bacterium]
MKPANFFHEFERLKLLQPRVPDYNSLNNENSNWGSFIHQSKNAYLSFDSSQLVDCGYISEGFKLTDCYDCDYSAECELCYECSDGFKLFDCIYCYDCSHLTDCHFCIQSCNCQYCFGCVGLNHKKYCFFNRQLSKKKYFKQLNYWEKQPIDKIFQELDKIRLTVPRYPLHMEHANNCWGDYIYHSSNCYFCFDSANNEDCGYLFDSHRNKNCYELEHSFWSELSYELIDSAHDYNCAYIYFSYSLINCDYMYACRSCEDCLGCVGLKNKKYCILNRQLTEKDYFTKVKQIKLQLGWQLKK